jgi:hypothetical protein
MDVASFAFLRCSYGLIWSLTYYFLRFVLINAVASSGLSSTSVLKYKLLLKTYLAFKITYILEHR